MTPCCRNLGYEIAARIFNASEPAAWATGPYFPYPNLNITGHVLVRLLTPALHVVIAYLAGLTGGRLAPCCTDTSWLS